jgi:ubiquitin thioesterase OTU1
MRLRLRAPAGQAVITLPDDSTVADLVEQIASKTSVSRFEVKYSYPPKALRLEEFDKSLPLSKLGIKLDNETLIISPKDSPSADKVGVKPPISQQSSGNFSFAGIPEASKSEKPSGPISLKKKPMEGDNVPEIPLLDRGATLGMLYLISLFLPILIYHSSTESNGELTPGPMISPGYIVRVVYKKDYSCFRALD